MEMSRSFGNSQSDSATEDCQLRGRDNIGAAGKTAFRIYDCFFRFTAALLKFFYLHFHSFALHLIFLFV